MARTLILRPRNPYSTVPRAVRCRHGVEGMFADFRRFYAPPHCYAP